VGVSVAAVGVGTLAVGAVFGLLAKVELDKSNGPGGCNTNNVCPGASNGERTTAFADGTIGTVFLIAGGAVAATGLTVFLVAPKTGEASGSRAAVRVGPGSLAVSGSF
jgi:hypothetical protein